MPVQVVAVVSRGVVITGIVVDLAVDKLRLYKLSVKSMVIAHVPVHVSALTNDVSAVCPHLTTMP